MKKNLIMAIAVMIGMAAIHQGCERNPYTPAQPESISVKVIKFKKPEYKNFVLANDFPEDTCFIAMRGWNCEEPIGQTGYSPYWELQDGWLLVDWNWPLFPYAEENTIALTEQTWDMFKGSMSSPHPTWSRSEPHVNEPIAEIIPVQVANLGKYYDSSYDDEMLNMIHSLSTGGMCYKEHYAIADSIWSVLQRDLSGAIENGDLVYINDEKYNPYR